MGCGEPSISEVRSRLMTTTYLGGIHLKAYVRGLPNCENKNRADDGLDKQNERKGFVASKHGVEIWSAR